MKIQRLLPFIIGLFLVFYVGARAYLLSLTHDEGLTFMHFMYAPLKDVITYQYPNANNHVLNTLLMRFMAVFFPLKDYWLRVPNVLLYLVYLIFSWKIVSDFGNKYWRTAAWLLLNSTPYLLDFFSLARGYGLSMGFIMASLYYLKLYLANPRYRTLIFCLLTAALAVLSSMVLLNYFLALSGVLFLHTLLAGKPVRFKWRTLEIYFAAALPLMAYSLYVSFRLRSAGELFFGSSYGFWQGTVKSLITRVLFKESAVEEANYYVEGLPYYLGSALIIIVLCAAAFCFIKRWRHGLKPFTFMQALLLLITLCALSIIAQFYILGTLMVLDRTALFFVPMFLVLVISLFRQELWEFAAARVVFGFLIVASCFNFFLHANFTHCLEWSYDANTETMMRDLKQYNAGKHDNSTRKLYPYWTYHPAAAFYQATEDFSFLRPVDRLFKMDHSFDYFYLPDQEMRRMNGRPVKIIRHYPLTQTTLFENLNPPKKLTFAEGGLSFVPKDSLLANTRFAQSNFEKGKNCVRIDPGQFGPYFPISASTLPKGVPLRIEIEAEIWCRIKPVGNLAVSLHTQADSQYTWNARQIGQAPVAPARWTRITYNQNLQQFISTNDVIKVYLWNTGTEPIYLSDMRAVVAGQPE